MKKVLISLYVAACLAFSVHVLRGQDEGGTKKAPDATPAVQAAPETVPAPAPAPAVAPAPAPITPPAVAVEEGNGDLVTITASDTKVQDLLRMLQERRKGANIIMGPEVQGTVSLAVRDLPWETALQTICEMSGCQAVKEGENLYRIRKIAAQYNAQIVLEMLKKDEVAALSQDAVDRYLLAQPGLEGKSAAERKEWLAQNSSQFVKYLQVDNRPAVEVVNMLAKQAGLNFAFNTGPVAGAVAPGTGAPAAAVAVSLPPVTLNLREVSVVDAMRLVAAQGGLSCNSQNGIWVVSPKPLTAQPLEPQIIETFQVDFLPVDDSLVTLVKGMISPTGQVRAGKNKVLIVRDTAENVEAVRRILEAMDKVTPQVLIEARFFELSDAARKDLGIDWNDLGENGVKMTASNLKPYDYMWSKVKINHGEPTTTTTKARTAILGVADFGAVLRALANDTGVRELSNPKILVASDEQATIHIGAQTPIIKSSIQQQSGTGSGNAVITYELDDAYGGEAVQEEQLVERPKGAAPTTQRGYTIRKGYLDLGTKLAVAPSVKTESEVYIKVVPELTSVTSEIQLKSDQITISYPELFTTRVRTEFTIQSGQTIAIGGLVSERTSKLERKIPWLGSIPFAGLLFRYDSVEKTRSEVIIFLTVTVVPSARLLMETGIPAAALLINKELGQVKEDDQRAYIGPEAAPQKPEEPAPAPAAPAPKP